MKGQRRATILFAGVLVSIMAVISVAWACSPSTMNGNMFWCTGQDGASTCLNLTSDGGNDGYDSLDPAFLKRTGNLHDTGYNAAYYAAFDDKTSCHTSGTLFTNDTDGGTVFTTASSVGNGGFLKEGTQDGMRKEVTLPSTAGYYTTCGHTVADANFGWNPTTILVF